MQHNFLLLLFWLYVCVCVCMCVRVCVCVYVCEVISSKEINSQLHSLGFVKFLM